MNILLLSNLATDLGKPNYREGAYRGFLLPLAKRLNAEGGADTRILANSFMYETLVKHADSEGFDRANLLEFDLDKLSEAGCANFMVQSYNEDLAEGELAIVGSQIDQTLGSFTPDVIICWEAPTGVFRKLYPDALVVDMMPGLFMRPPYPAMISLDTSGLYKDCWYSGIAPDAHSAPEHQIEQIQELRAAYSKHLDDLQFAKRIERATGISFDEDTILVPLQIGQYFGWKENTSHRNQTEFLKSILESAPAGKTVVPTQYVSPYTNDWVVTAGNLSNWMRDYPNLRYSPILERLDNVSQYLVGLTGTTVSVSSSLGLQALLFGKKLISPSNSHLSYVSHANALTADERELSTDAFTANYLFRTNVSRDRLVSEPGYAKCILEMLIERKSEPGVEAFPDSVSLGNSADSVLRGSNFKRSMTLVDRAIPPAELGRTRSTLSQLESALDETVHTVSFDVFDTLLVRTVLEPSGVFDIMGDILEKRSGYPSALAQNFAQIRAGTERKIRRILDETRGHGAELTIEDVYGDIATAFELGAGKAEEMVSLEQECELGCLIARHPIKRIFDEAIRAEKRVVIISDFIHSRDFVERALENAGISGWHHIYVSSEAGSKKHDGSLFDHVKSELGIETNGWVHIGDNPTGDVEMAKKAGIQPIEIDALPKKAIQFLAARRANVAMVRNSVPVGRILAGFAINYLDNANGAIFKEPTTLISEPEHIGFLSIGPLMDRFARDIRDRANSVGAEQIVCFARDTILPYRMLTEVMHEEGGPKIVYWPVSRRAVAGLNILDVSDLYGVRIDDFSRNAKLVDLFVRRFHLEADEIDLTELARWTDKPLEEVSVTNIPSFACYEIAVKSARAAESAFIGRLEQKRKVFVQAAEQWGTDFNKKTLTVDVGYKGSIHKSIKHFFSSEPATHMFASYPNKLGEDPVSNLGTSYFRNRSPQMKRGDPILQQNLLFETMINESCGSTLGYSVDPTSRIIVEKEKPADLTHQRRVQKIHEGAMTFSRWRHDNLSGNHDLKRLSQQVYVTFLDMLFFSPTAQDAKLLQPLVFDNSYSGTRPRRIIETSGKEGAVKSSMWREGAHAINSQGRVGSLQSLGDGASRSPIRLGRVLFPVLSVCVRRFGSERLYYKFRQDPVKFFSDSQNPTVRRIGDILF